MVLVPLCLGLAALVAQPGGRASTAGPEAGSAPGSDGRTYEGIRVVLPTSSVEPTVVAPSADGDGGETAETPTGTKVFEPPTPTAIVRPTDGSQPAEVIVSAVSLAPPVIPAPPPRPRILTTMDGWYPGEEARFRARGRYVSFMPGLQVRARVGSVSGFTLDDQGNRYEDGAYAAGRVRWRPVLGLGKRDVVKIIGMLDFANGRWVPTTSGDPVTQEIIDDGQPPIPTSFRAVDPRELYVQWTSRVGQLRLGQMSFSWGQGLVANDGNNMDRFGDLKFGNDGDGSIQERILFATKPFARRGGKAKDLVMALGADLIYRDPNADLVQGDRAGQGIFILRWAPASAPSNWVGGYAAYRRQKSADDGDAVGGDDLLEVGVADLAGQGIRRFGPRLALLGGFETALIAGRTTFLRPEREQHRVLQAAAAVRGYIGSPQTWLAGFDAGWFSGDSNPDDAEVNNFQAAPGYTAGLLLFQSYEGWQTARSELQASDPTVAAVPPGGTQYLPTRGRVTNVVFAHPKARYGLLERFEVWGGPLFAASAVPLIDPVAAQLGGGAPTNALGGAVERRYLGTELDLGLRGRYEFHDLWLQAGLQGGVLFPGIAFEGPQGDRDNPIYGGWFRAEIRY